MFIVFEETAFIALRAENSSHVRSDSNFQHAADLWFN
jgi:hypothetical protein